MFSAKLITLIFSSSDVLLRVLDFFVLFFVLSLLNINASYTLPLTHSIWFGSVYTLAPASLAKETTIPIRLPALPSSTAEPAQNWLII